MQDDRALTVPALLETRLHRMHLVGCCGEMKLTGGSGDLMAFPDPEGYACGAAFERRAVGFSELAATHGMIFWPELRYTLP